jgi:hypothetical protein
MILLCLHKRVVALLLACLVIDFTHDVIAEPQCNAADGTCASSLIEEDLSDCHVILGLRNVRNNDHNSARKLGVFANRPLPRGMPLPPTTSSEITGDVVIHLVDVLVSNTSQLDKWLSHGYLVDAVSSGYGGNYEGNGRVLTALPGIGMLASSFVDEGAANDETNNDDSSLVAKQGPNTWASIPTTDEANHPRRYSPLAGSFALNYNLTFRAIQPISIGEEITVDRSGWFRRNSLKGAANSKVKHMDQYDSVVCLDSNIYPSYSKNGRGAFASKSIQKGSVVAYSPVLPLPKNELQYLRKKDLKKIDAVPRDQLLLNYCFGHDKSSVLLFPYGSFVNYINHAPSELLLSKEDKHPTANVRVMWSERFKGEKVEEDPHSMTPANLWNSPSPEPLVFEYIALRDIQPNEEILLDYGTSWSDAWDNHVSRWKQDPLNKEGGLDAMADSNSNDYSPAYIMEDVVKSNLRTAEEQLSFPYQKNVFTACFYRYERTESNSDAIPSTTILYEATPWKMSRGLFDMTNLRPCKVISRAPATDRLTGEQLHGGKIFYTAIIQNRPGLAEHERIPNDTKHVVSGIPREAFRFVDRPYSSDEHLEGAFRHHIGLDETGMYPEAWLDL